MLLRDVDVLDIFVEPFIKSGFRLPNQPYSYYCRSLFFLHNETFSVWIHLAGTLILFAQVYRHLAELTSDLSSTLSLYLIYNCFGASTMLLCSAQAHLLHSRTLSDHLRSFFLDYFGINFYGFTSGIVLRKFSHQSKISSGLDQSTLETDWFYCFILSLLSLYSLSIACFCKIFYRRPYPWSHKVLQCSGVLFVYLYQIWPILWNVFNHWIYGENNDRLSPIEEKALFWHFVQFSFFLVSGLIFVCRIPERFRPGSFDLFGQSHHSFHLTIFLMAFSQANAVFYDVQSTKSDSVRVDFRFDFIATCIVFLLQIGSVLFWFRSSRSIVEQRYRPQSKTE